MSGKKPSFMDEVGSIDTAGSPTQEQKDIFGEEGDEVFTGDEEEMELVKLKNVQTSPRTKIAVSLARPILEEGEPVQHDEREPENAPVNIYPTNEGDITEYRTRRGQRKMKDLGRTVHVQARGTEGDAVEVERDVLRAPDVRAKIDEDILRVIEQHNEVT